MKGIRATPWVSPFQSEHLNISLDGLLRIRAPGTYLIRVAGDSMTRAVILDYDLLDDR